MSLKTLRTLKTLTPQKRERASERLSALLNLYILKPDSRQLYVAVVIQHFYHFLYGAEVAAVATVEVVFAVDVAALHRALLLLQSLILHLIARHLVTLAQASIHVWAYLRNCYLITLSLGTQ